MFEIFLKVAILFLIFFCIYAHRFIVCLPKLVYYCIYDALHYNKNVFRETGMMLFCGRQGSGKTIGMVHELERLRNKYKNVKIYTNFDYCYQTAALESLNDLLDEKMLNGTDGVIFAIDEIQNEFSSSSSKNFPESLLSFITQQRKQRVCILATSQVFTRVAKPLREQSYKIVDCKTLFGRYTKLKFFDADDYIVYSETLNTKRKMKLRILRVDCFVQTNELRNLYDSFQLIRRLSRSGFIAKQSDINVNNNITVVKRK